MPGERITLKTREKIRELKKENWVKEEEKDEEAEEAISRSLGRLHRLARSKQGKIILSSSFFFSSSSSSSSSFFFSFLPSLVGGMFEGQRVRRFGRGKQRR